MDNTIEKKQSKVTFIVYLMAPIFVGLLSSAISSGQMRQFSELNQPPLSPPAMLFPIAWSVLYVLMGIGSYLIYRSEHENSIPLLFVYFIQLFFNFFWSPMFFNAKMYWFAFVWLMIMWTMILFIVTKSYKISKTASFLFMPYLAWCTFAAYLNLMIAILN